MPRMKMDKVASWYDPIKLKTLFMWNLGEEYVEPAARMMHVEHRTAIRKINQTVLSHEDTIALAEGLHLTFNEYREIFLKDVKLRDE